MVSAASRGPFHCGLRIEKRIVGFILVCDELGFSGLHNQDDLIWVLKP